MLRASAEKLLPRVEREGLVAFDRELERDDASLLAALRRGDRGARAVFFKRFGSFVERMLLRCLGADVDLPDLVQEVFLGLFAGAHRLHGDAGALKSWVAQTAVFTARKHIRRRKARRWLLLDSNADAELPSVADADSRDAARRALHILERLPTDERIPFALVAIEGMELTEVATACDVSLATVKRRLSKARQRFALLALRDPILKHWVEGSGDA